MGFRRNCNVAGEGNQRSCECVFECLRELLEGAMDNNDICCGSVRSDRGNNCRSRNQVEAVRGSEIRCDCDCVFDCLMDLLEAATEEDHCRCPR